MLLGLMKIILSKQCASLTGSLGRGFGYSIQCQKGGFFSKRNSRGNVPPDGHIRFIFTCAKLAQNKLHIADIELHWRELYDALYEAYHFTAADHVASNGREAVKLTYNARDIINLKRTFGL